MIQCSDWLLFSFGKKSKSTIPILPSYPLDQGKCVSSWQGVQWLNTVRRWTVWRMATLSLDKLTLHGILQNCVQFGFSCQVDDLIGQSGFRWSSINNLTRKKVNGAIHLWSILKRNAFVWPVINFFVIKMDWERFRHWWNFFPWRKGSILNKRINESLMAKMMVIHGTKWWKICDDTLMVDWFI